MRPILKKYLASISKVKAEHPSAQRELSKEEIASTMRQWISEGKMFSSAMLNKNGVSAHEVGRRCASRQLFRSRQGAIIFTEEELRRIFEEWMYSPNKRVYTVADMDSLKGLIKLYDINKACANGCFLRFPDLGKSATLYIE